MKKVNCLFLLLVVSIAGFAQNNNNKNNRPTNIEYQYDNFKKTFDKEVGDLEPAGNKEEAKFISHLPPVQVPSWLSDFKSTGYDQFILTLGISDPGLDSMLATSQAVIRAKGMLALCCDASIQNITDSYINDYEGKKILGKFTSFSKIESAVHFAESDFQILKKEINSYGEVIILAGIPKTSCTGQLSGANIRAEYFLSEEGEFSNLKTYSNYSFTYTSSDGLNAVYTAYKTKKSILLMSEINGDSLMFDYGRFKYYSMPEPNPTDDELLSYTDTYMNNGLWNAWLSSFLRQVEMGEKYTSDLRNMDDHYTGKYQTLTREVSENRLSLRPVQIFVIENRLYLKIKQEQNN